MRAAYRPEEEPRGRWWADFLRDRNCVL